MKFVADENEYGVNFIPYDGGNTNALSLTFNGLNMKKLNMA